MLSNNTTLFNGTMNVTNSTARPVGGSTADVTTTVIMISVIISVGLIANSVVIVVVGCIPTMRTTTNYLLVNVAAADIITLLLTAIHVGLSRVASLITGPGSVAFCKIVTPNTLCNAALLATGLTLTVLSVERYNALVKPMKISRRLTKENVGYVIIGIWVVSMVMALPMLVYLNIDPLTGQCTPGDHKESLYISLTIIVIFITIAPFLVIAFCYFQIISGLYFTNTIYNATMPGHEGEDLAAKKKLVKRLLLVTVIYFIAFVPTGVTLILKFRSILDSVPRDAQELARIRALARVTVYLMPLHSALNPFFYAFPSQNYREGFIVVLKKIFSCCKKPENNNNIGNRLTGAI